MKTEENKIETVKKDITVSVLTRIAEFQKTGELKLPPDYSAENALKAAYLALPEVKGIENCTPASVGNALLKMVVNGLSPLKKQCDFIAYGNKLECQIEYTGNIALAKRYGQMKDIKGKAVFEGDEFEFETNPETGRTKILKHKQSIQSMASNKVIGAYAIVYLNDGTIDCEIMSMEQIKAAWNQGAMKGNSPAHKNFPDQMAIKTVINRACKLLVRGSSDAVLFDNEDEQPKQDKPFEDAKFEVMDKANKEVIDFPVEEQANNPI